MSAVLEVSDGYPVDGRPFEPPQVNRDQEKPRYIAFVGSVIEPTRIAERPLLKFGGMEIGNPCLRYVKHYVRKGRITPVLKDLFDWVTADYWEKATGKDASYFPRPIPPGYTPPLNESGVPSPIRSMYGKVAVPGQQMDSILNGSANVLDRTRRGVVELTELAGHEYNPQPVGEGIVTDPAIWQIQRAIFPDYPLMLADGKPTVLLDEIEDILINAQQHSTLRSIVDKYLTSLNQFRDYARSTLDQTHYRMRESASKSESGYIWRYTELDFVLMEQLGIQRQDREIRQQAKVSSTGKMEELFEQFLQLQIEEKQANLERERRLTSVGQAEPIISQDSMAAAPINVTEPKPEFYTCEHCNEQVKVAGRSFHVGRWCKVLHPREVAGEANVDSTESSTEAPENPNGNN